MGVFSGRANEAQMMGIGYESPKQCKRDYEGEINRLRKQAKAASALLLAVDEYCDCSYGSGEATFTLNGLIGGLTREIKQLNKGIEGLTEEWEANK